MQGIVEVNNKIHIEKSQHAGIKKWKADTGVTMQGIVELNNKKYTLKRDNMQGLKSEKQIQG